MASTPLQNIFIAIPGPSPAQIIESRPDHPVSPPTISNHDDILPISTNKFYGNFLLGSQASATWTHPYSVCWTRGNGNARSWGLAVSHTDEDQRAYGPDARADPIQYYFNPIGIQSLIISALELGGSTTLSFDSLTAFSANVNIHSEASSPPSITIPLVQGMGFITGIYRGSTPLIESSVFFRNTTAIDNPRGTSQKKYKILLEDGKTWLLYATSIGSSPPLTLRMRSNTRLESSTPFTGYIQIAKNRFDNPDIEKLYDSCAGAYPSTATISGFVSGFEGSYTFNFRKEGSNASGGLLIFALPHHVQSFTGSTAEGVRPHLQMQTTTKGLATAVVRDSWSMSERDLPIDVGFSPLPESYHGYSPTLPPEAIEKIRKAAVDELDQDFKAQCCLDSMYFSGKGLTKFAMLIWTVQRVLRDDAMTRKGLDQLKDVLAVFISNKQQFPLVYETTWKGVVSSGSYVTGNSLQDFGNTYYNDHHFHYGYFIYAAAVVGCLDPTWLQVNANKDWVNMLVRDAANPSFDDPEFPFSRAFDWWHGHSWAKGLFESADGKDEESSSEDAFFAYAIKMWGVAIGDKGMEARGNLMLAIMKRSFGNYLLLEDRNQNQPAQFVGNKVTGILFENKVDHTTYFGHVMEYIEGIHMIPINPSTSYIRSRKFVEEEWQRYFDNGRAAQVAGGWRGLAYASLATIDPASAWTFFAQDGFRTEWLDGGASLTWYLFYTAGE